MAALVGTVSVTHQRQVPAVFTELVDGASLQFFDRVVVIAVILQRQVVDIPVMAQLQDILVCLPLRLRVRCPRCAGCAGPADSCESRGIRSRSHSCSSYSLGQVVVRPLRASSVPMVDDSVQFIDGVNVPVILRDSGSAPDSVHRGYGGHSSSQQRQVLDLTVAAMMGLYDAFCVIFRAPPVIPELSASFSSFRVLTTVSARGLQRVCQFMNCGDGDIHTLIASSEQQQQQ